LVNNDRFDAGEDAERKEFAIVLKQVYDEIEKYRDDGKYVINPAQMNKFLDLLSWFMHKAEEFGDKVNPPKINPGDEHGSLSAVFKMLDMRGIEESREFANLIKECSILSFLSGKEGVIIECTVPNIFVEMNEK